LNPNNPDTKKSSKKSGSTRPIKSIVLPSFSWFISGYDLSLDTIFANSLAKAFFPVPDFTYSLLAIFGVLSLSLLARFGGALVLGRLGDKLQRKVVVIISISLLTGVMFLSAVLIYWILPSSLPLSITTSIFILTRILIGFSIGGLWPTASVWGLENISFNRQSKYVLPIETKERKFRELMRKDLLPHGGAMQLGFHAGWFVSAFLAWQISSEINTFGMLSIIGGIVSLFLLIFCVWKLNSSDMLEKRKESLEKCGKMHELGSFRTLFLNHKDAIINLWLIMNGLFFLYYPSTVITTKVLTLGKFIPFESLPSLPINIFLLIIVLFAHAVPVLVYWRWSIWKKGSRAESFITKTYLHLYNYYYTIYLGIRLGVGLLDRREYNKEKLQIQGNSEDIEKISKENLDIITIVLTGLLLIIVILTFLPMLEFPFNRDIARPNMNTAWGLIVYTSIVIFVANTIWTLIPSLLSGSFPTELRNTASTLIYQGGLVIAFSTPFISMQYFLLSNQQYLLDIPTILGAISIIIGGGRMVGLGRIKKKDQKSKIFPRRLKKYYYRMNQWVKAFNGPMG
jgi:MFS family permease